MDRIHNDHMTELLEIAIERARALSPEMQDDLARILLRLAGEEEQIYQLTSEEEADLIAADDEIARGEFATDEEVQAVFARHGR
jgi:hypothetical protein